MLLPFLITITAAQAAPCPELTELSAQLRTAIDSVELEQAQQQADRLPAALDCQAAPVAPLALHTALVAAGAAHHFQGDDAQASALFHWAASVAPTSLADPALGEDVGELYRTARSAALAQPPATVVVGQGPAWVDGTACETNTPLTLSPGAHLVQWTHPSGELVNLRFSLDSGEQLHLAGGVLPVSAALAVTPAPVIPATVTVIPAPGTPAPPASKTRTGRAPAVRWMRIGGAVGMLAGSGFLLASAQAHQQFDQSQRRAELVALQQTVNSRTLIGASSATVGGALLLTSWSPRLHNGSAP